MVLIIFMYVTICQPSGAGSFAQEGIARDTSPLVMYQKISPSVADCAAPFARLGMLPMPWPWSPWHLAQLLAKSCAPATPAECFPASGFFVCAAVAGAS